MKKIYTIGFLMSLSFLSFGQFETEILEFNNAKGMLTNGGVFFHDGGSLSPGYEIPASSGNHAIFAMGFWFGGVDVSAELKLAASKYADGGDFFPGALTTDGSAEVPLAETVSKGVYPMDKALIDYHIEHAGEMGYVVPSSILDWPAHGDVALGLDFYLAPFVDVDGDGIYNPEIGDYPKIKGDQAVYMIVNDKGGVHASGGNAIGLEVHYMFYQYASDDFLNNTTFINMRAINRGTQTLFNFKEACYLDSDIGFAEDDYAGCYAENNVMFAYNADLNDEGGAGQPGYGLNPPAIGVVLLNRDAYAYTSGGGFMDESPTAYYNYMSARWPDGTHFTEGGAGYGGDTETNFVFNGNPNVPSDWSEVQVATVPGDRRMMMSTDLDIFRPDEVICLDYAVLYNRDGSPLENAEGIINLAEEARSFYEAEGGSYCSDGFLGLEKAEKSEQITVYPNPSNGSFLVTLEGNFDVEIYSLDGRLVFAQSNNVTQAFIETHLADGTYALTIFSDNESKKVSQLITIK